VFGKQSILTFNISAIFGGEFLKDKQKNELMTTDDLAEYLKVDRVHIT